MTSTFLVQAKAVPGISAAVLSSGSRSPMDELDLLEQKLKRMRIRGLVLFDLLLVNGNKDRYYMAAFNGEHFEPYRLENVDSRKAEFQKMSAAIYKEKVAQIDIERLSPALRLAVTRGVPI